MRKNGSESFCNSLRQDPRILKPSVRCFPDQLDHWMQNFRYPHRFPLNSSSMYEEYVEDFINDAVLFGRVP